MQTVYTILLIKWNRWQKMCIRDRNQITNGDAVISGMKSYEDAEALASQIRSGALKLELEELQSEVVGAKLGSQAIKTSIIAAIIGLLIIIAFMLIAYRIPGLAASIALLIYTGIVLAILHLYHITLTLPGIAGIILSIGMAVDANVIIFARIREEIAAGHSVAQSIDTVSYTHLWKYDILLTYVRRKEISEDETRKNIKYKKITEHSKKRRMW